MKTWLNKLFGNEQHPASAVAGEPAASHPPQMDAERTILADAERTVPAAAPHNPQAIQAAESNVAAEWKIGDVILDTYEVKHIHAGGGMGLVYRVHHRGWNMDLAVKTPRTEYFQTAAQKENFIRECETWINLGLHPHIVSCYYVRTLEGVPRVFAEYVEGGTLKEWIDSRKLYEPGPQESVKRILDIAIQMAWGLDYAHEQGLIHQDVKPSNIMLMSDGTVKVTDFGLAKARGAMVENAADGKHRSILASCGGMTPAYCSPEQAEIQAKRAAGMTEDQLPKLTRRTDIWSWAVSVFEMFYGELPCPHGGQTAGEVLENFLSTPMELGGVPPMPKRISELLRLCLVRDVGQRPNDFAGLVQFLTAIYFECASEVFPRRKPQAVELAAASLNNKAVSLQELEKLSEARSTWARALECQPHHPESVYNLGLLEWRSGEIADDVLITRLTEAQRVHAGNPLCPYFIGMVHLERLDSEGAVASFKQAVAGGDKNAIQMLEKAQALQGQGGLRCTRVLEGHRSMVKSVAISEDGRWIASGSQDGALRFWDTASGRCFSSLEAHKDDVNSVAISSDGKWVLSGGKDRTVRLWEAKTGKCIRMIERAKEINCVAFSSDDRLILVVPSFGEGIEIWNAASGGCLSTLVIDGTGPGAIALLAGGSKVLSGDRYGGIITLWDIDRNRWAGSFSGHTSAITSIHVRSTHFLSSSLDGTVRLWELDKEECVRKLHGHTDMVTCAAFLDESLAVSGSHDNTLKMWDLNLGFCISTLRGHESAVSCVAVAGDAQMVISGSWDGTLRLWDVSSARSAFRAPAALSRQFAFEEAFKVQAEFERITREIAKLIEERQIDSALLQLREAKSLPGFEHHPKVRALNQQVAKFCARKTGLAPV